MYSLSMSGGTLDRTVQTHPSTVTQPAGQQGMDVLLRYGDSPVSVILEIAILIGAITSLIKILVPVMVRK